MDQKKLTGISWKIGFFTLLAFLIIGANVFVWFFWGEGVPPQTKVMPTSTPSPVAFEQTTPTSTVDETELIKQAVFQKTGLTASQAEVSINKNTGQHATGNIKEFEAVGGAYWLAAETADGWVCVYDGQAQPTCAQIAPYNFPKDMVPECLDKNGNVVKR
jgi:hypothetical protein